MVTGLAKRLSVVVAGKKAPDTAFGFRTVDDMAVHANAFGNETEVFGPRACRRVVDGTLHALFVGVALHAQVLSGTTKLCGGIRTTVRRVATDTVDLKMAAIYFGRIGILYVLLRRSGGDGVVRSLWRFDQVLVMAGAAKVNGFPVFRCRGRP